MRFSSDVLPRQPFTWAQPVMPGLTLWRSMYCGNCVLELVHEVRALGPRADERHVPLEHVPELRQFVEVEAPQEAAERRAARVVVTRPDRAGLALGVEAHRAELVDRERPAVEAHALLAVEDRAGRGEADERRDDGERDGQQQEGDGRQRRCRPRA